MPNRSDSGEGRNAWETLRVEQDIQPQTPHLRSPLRGEGSGKLRRRANPRVARGEGGEPLPRPTGGTGFPSASEGTARKRWVSERTT